MGRYEINQFDPYVRDYYDEWNGHVYHSCCDVCLRKVVDGRINHEETCPVPSLVKKQKAKEARKESKEKKILALVESAKSKLTSEEIKAIEYVINNSLTLKWT